MKRRFQRPKAAPCVCFAANTHRRPAPVAPVDLGAIGEVVRQAAREGVLQAFREAGKA